jgi:hypothetical protein
MTLAVLEPFKIIFILVYSVLPEKYLRFFSPSGKRLINAGCKE